MSADEQDTIAAFLGVSLEDVVRRRGEAAGFGEGKQSPYAAAQKDAAGVNDDGARKTHRHPIFGYMKGTMTIPPDLDLTAPADPEWGKVYADA